MSDDDLPPLEDLEAWKARFGEYRHIPLVRYGAFRIDRVEDRWPSHPDKMWSKLQLVFEINDRYEFDILGYLDTFWDLWFGERLAEGQVLTRAQTLRFAIRWWAGISPKPDGGMVSLACYRRRVGPVDDAGALTPGDWFINPLFRRPSDPMISMAEAASFVEAALRQLQQAETDDETPGQSRDA